MPIITILLLSFFADNIMGDPVYPLHPVRLIGNAIQLTEKTLRKYHLTGIAGGVLLLLIVVIISTAIFTAIHIALYLTHPVAAMAWDSFILYSCIAMHDMIKHAMPIAKALQSNDLRLARELVQKIVGRDASRLNNSDVARATVESISEGFVDGFFAPIFWFAAAAAVAALLNLKYITAIAVGTALLYRTVNTLDSMVGYKNERYINFGKASAITDDILNFIPARLAILVLLLASAICGTNTKQGWKVVLRDRLKHTSPNSGHTESFIAGVLNVRLGGPTIYAHGTVNKPWLCENGNDADYINIIQTCRIIKYAGIISILIISTLGVILK